MKKILKTLSLCCSLFLSLSLISSCQNDFIEDTVLTGEEEQGANQIALIATIIDGLYENWNKGDVIMLLHNGRTVSVEAQENGITSNLSGTMEGIVTDANPLYGVYPAENAYLPIVKV